MNKRKEEFKKFITVTIIVTVIISLIFGSGEHRIQTLAYNLLYSTVFTAANFIYFIFINKLLSWKNKPKQTLFISLLGVIPLNFSIYYLLNFLLSYFVHGESFDKAIKINSFFSYVFVIVFSLSIALFILMLIFFKMITEEKIKNEKLKTETAKSRFNSLKSQLDPHFLFNNLNVLTALIHENPDKAEEFTLQLADIYRYLLSTEDKELIPLDEEISFAKQYMYLLNLRFENQLDYSFPQKLPPGKKIPPLSLQLLLENIIKHNVFTEKKPLKIFMYIEDEFLIVKNELRKRVHSQNTSQKGLFNLKQRYNLLGNKKIEINEEENYFIVKIPLL